MTDINKQIEEEARAIEYKQEIDLYSDLYEGLVGYEYACDLMESLKIEAYKNGYNKALHSSRWRKVSEWLPEVKDENFFINIKRYDNEFRIDTICVFAEMEDVKGYLEFNNVDSWKPID